MFKNVNLAQLINEMSSDIKLVDFLSNNKKVSNKNNSNDLKNKVKKTWFLLCIIILISYLSRYNNIYYIKIL